MTIITAWNFDDPLIDLEISEEQQRLRESIKQCESKLASENLSDEQAQEVRQTIRAFQAKLIPTKPPGSGVP